MTHGRKPVCMDMAEALACTVLSVPGSTGTITIECTKESSSPTSASRHGESK